MRANNFYVAKVNGCGKRPIEFSIAEVLAGAVFEPKKGQPRKAELAVTGQGMIVGRKVVYSKQVNGHKKIEQYKKFANLMAAKKWFSTSKREEREVLSVINAQLTADALISTKQFSKAV
jgi:hypothetical protein